jgi:hypothetical protein
MMIEQQLVLSTVVHQPADERGGVLDSNTAVLQLILFCCSFLSLVARGQMMMMIEHYWYW